MRVLRDIPILSSLEVIFVVEFILVHAQSIEQSDEICPEGYVFHTDQLCYPKVRKTCISEAESTTTAIPITAAMHSPLNIKKLDCPEGSVMMKNKCRKIICSYGEYYRGACLQPVCPQGLVWREKKCQKPGYLTTIFEIDNVILNEVNEEQNTLVTNDFVYHISTTTTRNPFTTSRSYPLIRTTQKRKYSTILTTAKYEFTNSQYTEVCCKVFTTRICKLHGNKWLCFHRKYQRCDSRICISPVVYLKAPEIKYEHPLLIMPPNPQLIASVTNNGYNDLHDVDCSGCVNLRFENCSQHCYRHICPKNICAFMDLNEYCNIFHGQDGCMPIDGCLWEWCQT